MSSNVDFFFELGPLIRMEIASNNETTPASNGTTSDCVEQGGTPLPSGACLCPLGLSSEYDSMITGNFCTVASQYSPIGNDSSANATNSSSTGTNTVVTFSGVIQLMVSFGCMMLVVFLVRKSISCCCRKSTNSFSQVEPYWNS